MKTSLLIRKKAFYLMIFFQIIFALYIARIFYIQFFRGEELQAMAFEQQTRDRLIRPNRGSIFDRNMVGLAVTETVAGVSVIYAQMKDIDATAKILARELELDEKEIHEKISKRVALVRVAQKVPVEVANKIRAHDLPGVVIDEDIKRVYPFGSLASQVIGFVGKDNQGIIGLEAKYDSVLMGSPGRILTETDVAGRFLEGSRQYRIAPVDGFDLVVTIDSVLQSYAEQAIELIVQQKNAARGVIILMNPMNGQIYALANKPDFDLNAPFEINNFELSNEWKNFSEEKKMNALNQMWRN
ncbi:MAG: peptidoglycan glycosyltransferase, partial [Defluviitaleaceae bacterium]|nr:peptidoglycan glycosyltransferase [Defluviitaleaceae bacterium]